MAGTHLNMVTLGGIGPANMGLLVRVKTITDYDPADVNGAHRTPAVP